MNQNYKIIFFLMMLITCGLEATSSFSLAPIGGNSVLHEAVAENDLKKIKKTLNKGVSVDVRNKGLSTPLHSAVYKGAYDSIKLLLENKANVNAQNWYGNTPLHIIFQNSDHKLKDIKLKIVVLLLQYGADMTLCNYNGCTALYRAAQNVDNCKIITFLLEKNIDFEQGNLLLDAMLGYHIAVSEENIYDQQELFDFIMLLINRGFTIKDTSRVVNFISLLENAACRELFQILCDRDVNLISRMSLSLFDIAVMNEFYEVLEFLLKNGSQGDIKDRDGLTPLYYAVTKEMYNFLRTFPQVVATDDNDTFDKVIAYKNKSEIKMDEDGQTLLHRAVLADDWYAVKRLINLGANVNKHDSKEGYTPLHYAVHINSVSLSQLLIESGADINSKNNQGLTPLHLTTQNREGVLSKNLIGYTGGLCEICQLLIASGADINVLDQQKKTPLHYAGYYNATKVAELLIKSGANIYVQDYQGLTPLHYAACYEKSFLVDFNTMVVQILLEAGADANSKTYRGYSPLYYALFSQSHKGYDFKSWHEISDIVCLLVDAGADVNSKDNHEFSLLHYAVNSDLLYTVQFLLHHGAQVNLLDLHGKTALDYAKSKETKKLFSQVKKR